MYWFGCVTGVHAVAYAFPNVRLVTTAVDPVVNDQFHIIPGIGASLCCSQMLHIIISQNLFPILAYYRRMHHHHLCVGNFGDRYFGTEMSQELPDDPSASEEE